jgi:transposase-like protein
MRKRYTTKFKAEIVRQVLQENKTIAEIASEHGSYPNQINRWKAIALITHGAYYDDGAYSNPKEERSLRP